MHQFLISQLIAVLLPPIMQFCNFQKVAISCSGYRISTGGSHHFKTSEVAKVALAPSGNVFTDYFETCRRKRNNIDYDSAEVVSETEADELLEKAKEFSSYG